MEEKTRKSSDARIRANMKYIKNNIKQCKFDLNKNTEADIIEHLDKQPNKQGYIKGLIRNDMSKNK